MRKLLIFSGVVLLGYHYRDKIFGTKKTETTQEPDDETMDNMPSVVSDSDVFSMYNNQVIADKDGYWMLVKDGKLYTPLSLETLKIWQKANPNKPQVVDVKESVWLNYGQKNYGGSF